MKANENNFFFYSFRQVKYIYGPLEYIYNNVFMRQTTSVSNTCVTTSGTSHPEATCSKFRFIDDNSNNSNSNEDPNSNEHFYYDIDTAF